MNKALLNWWWQAGSVPIGYVYNKSSWSDLSDFTTFGSISASVVSNQIQVSGGAGDFTQGLILTAYGVTMLENYTATIKIKVGTKTSTSFGIGFGTKSINAWSNQLFS